MNEMEVVTEVFEMGGDGLVDDSIDGDHRPAARTASVAIHCLTPKHHLELCSTDTRRKNQQSDACNTGLRVYDGAAILGEFFLSDAFLLSTMGRFVTSASSAGTSSAGTSSFSSSHRGSDGGGGGTIFVELGCGCGLAGLCAMAAVSGRCRSLSPVQNPEKSSQCLAQVIFTDASHDCLTLVERSAAQLCADQIAKHLPTLSYTAALLDWENPTSFFDRFPNLATPPRGADVVFGSDLVYFHASPISLFKIAERLMRQSTSSSPDQPPPPIILLSHYCRIADGRKRLAEAAALSGLALFQLPLSAFLKPSAILPRGRGDMQFLIGCRICDQDEVACDMFRGVISSALEPFVQNSIKETTKQNEDDLPLGLLSPD